MLTLNTNSSHTFYEEDQWGQFIDIECQELFPKQIIQYITKTTTTTTKTTTKTTTTTTKTTTTTTPPLKSILKKPININPEIYPPEKEKNQKNQKIKYNLDEGEKNETDINNQLQKFIEKQIYIGCLICILTFTFCLLP
jgi:hypothetical protein